MLLSSHIESKIINKMLIAVKKHVTSCLAFVTFAGGNVTKAFPYVT